MSDIATHPTRPAAPQGHGHLRDIVYGAIDGSVTTFAIVAGVAGAGLSPAVIVALGIANVLADGFSMAAGNYSGTKAEHDDLQRLRRETARSIDEDPDGARTALRAALAAKGLCGETLEAAVIQVSTRRERWISLMIDREHGLSELDPHPMQAALATFGAFLAAGLVPMLPFLLGLANAFPLSSALTLATFFGIGAYKSRWSLAPWWRSGTETLMIGGLAAAIAYCVGTLFAV